MRNFFYRVTGAIARFMYGRNGTDQLNAALLAAYLLVQYGAGVFFYRRLSQKY